MRRRRSPQPPLAVYTMTAAALILTFSCFLHASLADKDIANQRPRQVRVEVLNSTSIRLKWRQPKAEIVCGTKRYMIRLKEISRSTTTTSDKHKARVWKFNSSHTSAIIHDLRPNSEYMIRVVAENCDLKWKSSKWVTAKTPGELHKPLDRTAKEISDNDDVERRVEIVSRKNGRPPGQPIHVRTEPGRDSVSVSWQAPPSDARSIVRGYMIGYGEGVPDVNWQYVEGRQRNVTIKNLKAATQYVVSVSAYNDIGKSTPVYTLIYTSGTTGSSTANSSLLPTPSSLRVKPLTSSSVQLEWSDSSLGFRQELTDGRYYNVHYRVTPDGKVMSILVKDVNVVLRDLLPSTRYEFRIRTIREGMTSNFSDTVIARTTDDEDDEEDEEQLLPDDRDNDDDVEEENEMEEEQLMENSTGAGVTERYDWDPHSGGEMSEQGTTRKSESVAEAEDYSYANPETDEELKRQAKGPTPEEDVDAEDQDLQLLDRVNQSLASNSVARKRRIQPRRNSLYAVRFRSVVYHKITAFVTWPQHPQTMTPGCSDQDAQSMVIGYLLRYQPLPTAGQTESDVYTTKELLENFLLLENLIPESRYRYQVQYLLSGNGSTSTEWSGEGIIDTHYAAALPKSAVTP